MMVTTHINNTGPIKFSGRPPNIQQGERLKDMVIKVAEVLVFVCRMNNISPEEIGIE